MSGNVPEDACVHFEYLTSQSIHFHHFATVLEVILLVS